MSAYRFRATRVLLRPPGNDLTPLGAISFPDSCTITLTDTARATQMTFGRRLIRGPNEITVTWNPAGSPGPVPHEAPHTDRLAAVHFPTTPHAFEWRLFQNYPNPFN